MKRRGDRRKERDTVVENARRVSDIDNGSHISRDIGSLHSYFSSTSLAKLS